VEGCGLGYERGNVIGYVLRDRRLTLHFPPRSLEGNDAVGVDIDELQSAAVGDVDVVWLPVLLNEVSDGGVNVTLSLKPRGASGAVLYWQQLTLVLA
jgi:hypothetical protein